MDVHIKAVIFDLGNVLIDFDHTISAKRISKFTEMPWQDIFGLFFDSELTGLFEEGKITAQDFFSKVKEILNLKLDYDTFVPIWNDIFFLTKHNRFVYNLAQDLRKTYKLALLSNINILHFDYFKKNFSIFKPFHHIILSYEVGLRKPDPLIYKKTLEVLESEPTQVFYTDDRQQLIQGAKELGIHAFVFKDTEQLKKDLRDRGMKF